MRGLQQSFLAMAVALLSAAASAQTYPSKPIKVIVSQAAGSTPDIICRILADNLSPLLGQALVIENRPGAGNVVGAQAAARSEPDGYTLFFATAAALATNPYTTKNLPYDATTSFTAVGKIASGPFFILSNPSVPANNLAELFALDKRDPGKLSVATEGARNFTGILASWLNRKAGTQFVEVPYTTIVQGIQDVVSGRVQVISLPITSSVSFISSGQLKPLAVSSLKSMPGFESVPPIAATLPGVELTGWFAMVAPAGTPAAVVDLVNQKLDAVLKDPKIKARLLELGFFTDGAGTLSEAAAFLKDQYETWGKVAKDIGLEPQ